MKSKLCLLVIAILISMTACSSAENSLQESTSSETEPIVIEFGKEESRDSYEITVPDGDANVDVDLSVLNSVMMYASLENIKMNPEEYVGKLIKIKGYCEVYFDSLSEQNYYSAVIYDSTACCTSGLEFILTDDFEYPQKNEIITVIGKLSSYEDPNYGRVYHLVEAILE